MQDRKSSFFSNFKQHGIHFSTSHLLHLIPIHPFASTLSCFEKMSDKVKEVAIEEYEQARVLARDAARSGAYLYPLKVSSFRYLREDDKLTIS